MQLAPALWLVQLEPGAERDGMPVSRRGLEGIGHGGRDRNTGMYGRYRALRVLRA